MATTDTPLQHCGLLLVVPIVGSLDMCSDRAAKRFTRDQMWQQLVSSRAAFEKVAHVHAVYDGVRCDDEELVSYGFYSTELEAGTWGPPQVLRQTSSTLTKLWTRTVFVCLTPKWGHVLPQVFGASACKTVGLVRGVKRATS